MDRLMSMRVFQKVVDEGGFSAAARALDMSSAGVTRQIADLEEHLGTRLLHRTTRKVALSPAGEAYLLRIRNILQEIDQADAMASSLTHELAGELHLLAAPTLTSDLLAPLIMGFKQQYPGIELHIDMASAFKLPIEDYDVTLMETLGDYNGDVIARKVLESQAVLVASPGYLQRKGEPRKPEDLLEHDILRISGCISEQARWRLYNTEQNDAAYDVEAKPKLWFNQSDTLVKAAIEGAGICAGNIDTVAPYIQKGALVRVLSPWIAARLTLYAALPSRKFIPERTRAFLEYLTEHTREHRQPKPIYLQH